MKIEVGKSYKNGFGETFTIQKPGLSKIRPTFYGTTPEGRKHWFTEDGKSTLRSSAYFKNFYDVRDDLIKEVT